MSLKTCHLFAGIGGGLLADRILGHDPIIAVEWDRYACQVLRERAADGWFPNLRVWEGDVRLFDPSEYAGKVDCIHAGFPCQDISVAGNQAGLGEGTRSGLYLEVLRVAGIVRPRYLFLENVAAILSNGLGTVLADLASMGYDTRWICLRASDVGAPHHRDRWFLLANTNKHGDGNIRRWRGICHNDRNGEKKKQGRNELGFRVESSSEVLADPISKRQQGQGKFINAVDSAEAETRQATDVVNGGQQGFWAAEPDVGGMVDEFSYWLDKDQLTNNISRYKITHQVMGCCDEKKDGRKEVLRILRNGDVTKEIQRSSGRFISIYETAILLAELCRSKGQPNKARIFTESAETLKTELRGMWLRKGASCSPRRPEQQKQRAEQHSDIMQALPQLLAHNGKAHKETNGGENAVPDWWVKEVDILRVANGVSNRVDKLKGLGNAQVPLQAAVAWKLLGGE